MNITINNPMTGADVERYFSKVVGDDILNIKLAGNPRWRFLAESSLLSLLLHAATVRSKVFVHLTSVQNGELPETVRRQLTETIPGLLLGRFTDDLFDAGGKRSLRDDVRTLQKLALRAGCGVVHSGHEAGAIALDDFLAPSPAGIFEPSRSNSSKPIEELVKKLVGADSPIFIHSRYVWHFMNELVQNTRDHALKGLDGRTIRGARFLTVRRMNANAHSPRWYEGADIPFVDYLRELNDESMDFVELTVADSGIGIAARLASRIEVYEDSIEDEIELLARAFRSGESSKLQSVHGCGEGLPNVLRDVKALRGMLTVRTGRLLKYKHFASESAGSLPAKIVKRPLARGTTISILVPWRCATK